MRTPIDINEAEQYLSIEKSFYANGRSMIWVDQYIRSAHNLPVSPYAIRKNPQKSASYTFDPLADSIEEIAKRTLIW